MREHGVKITNKTVIDIAVVLGQLREHGVEVGMAAERKRVKQALDELWSGGS